MTSKHTMLLAAGLAGIGALVGVRSYYGDACCSGKDQPAAGKAPSVAASGTTATIGPGESVDQAFDGCKASCGSRSPADRAAARAQPGAALGDVVFCPVSGAVFRVREQAVKREVAGKALYFCCASCAAYFDGHRADILSARGIAPSGV